MGRAKGELNTKCSFCNKLFHLNPYWIKRGRHHCSRACWIASKNIPNIICQNCGIKFFKKPSQIRTHKNHYCSHSCYAYSLRGHTGKNKKKEYITPLTRIIKKSIEAKEWREHIFQRDKRRCQECFQKSKYIQVHHIKSFAEIFKEFLMEYNQFSPMEDKETLMRLATSYKPFWDIFNGITLCEICHKVHIHRWRMKPCSMPQN